MKIREKSAMRSTETYTTKIMLRTSRLMVASSLSIMQRSILVLLVGRK